MRFQRCLSNLHGQLLAIGVGLLGGMIPAVRAARMLPTAALRHE